LGRALSVSGTAFFVMQGIFAFMPLIVGQNKG
jgi:hypothetical protein